ncbi:mitochondrial carrier [Basidiobolus meristosporus CBS 931.73]|uniref:Mitochondrial carrier n=1 Tax=Basidiobolus meristosporus CBS 931.73 TaxID=1314790 RepID=A0A1Y1YQW0_9FUNG|nr:mitochondrial carrier [Basidiobolus meristosporus CBS 931.73]|eukprot:ORY00413.1 mitochondrial carrier [Basidiobolus meristosporus CBS 931.73]
MGHSSKATESTYPPYLHSIVAGGLGGSMGDFVMHSVDTVKTRLQGQPYPFKYTNMIQAYRTILREEGVVRGLYGGLAPAMGGSIPGTMIYFGTYEFVKRNGIAYGIPDTAVHLAAGSLGDLAASIVFVPSEVLKTRMQLQGRYNNPHFVSGYNYKGTLHALKMILKYDGPGALYNGYKATILRDVPFSALQFAFYEKLKVMAISRSADGHMSFVTELLIGGLAGGAAGAITTPLDVMKTILQTQVKKPVSDIQYLIRDELWDPRKEKSGAPHKYYTGIIDGLRWNYKQEGISGLFRGLAPRVFWTSLQSAGMFVIFEQALALFAQHSAKAS